MRDDFTKKTKENLAKRVGYHCSLCGKPTAGPGEASDGVSVIGVAAHICAASPGGPRYDSAMTSEERSDIDNGIWCCQNCAHLIDTNTEFYTIKCLRRIKTKAEEHAFTQISSNGSYKSKSKLSDNTKNKLIAAARAMCDGGKILRDRCDRYRPAESEGDDINIYNVCAGIYVACGELVYVESKKHMQLSNYGLDMIIFNLRDTMPLFYDAQQDWTGIQMIATNTEYMRFFASDAGKAFIKKCENVIITIEGLQ